MISKVILPVIISIMIIGCSFQNVETEPESINEGKEIVSKDEEVKMDSIKLIVNEYELEVELEENSTTLELIEKLKNGDIVINASEYGGFEKVGSLGFSIIRNDEQITTKAGDIVLYQGNQISLFYNSNAWSYTKIGRIKNITQEELISILGDGDVVLTFKL